MDLVAIQNSQKKIRNPFGVSFVWTWDGKPIELPGDGKWYNVIGALRDHLATHLYNKVRHQYIDEQVEKLTEKNQDKEARAYTIPRAVENQIWKMITDEDLYVKEDQDIFNNQPKMQIQSIDESLRSADNGSFSGQTTHIANVSSILEQANREAELSLDVNKNAVSQRGGGMAAVTGDGSSQRQTGEVNTAQAETITVNEPAAQPDAPFINPQAEQPSQPAQPPHLTATDTFADLPEINDEQPL